jgi:hypothetical protein
VILSGTTLKRWILAALLALLQSVGLPRAAMATEPPDGCEPMIYRLLPGQFNYCVGRHLWESGRYQRAVEML